MPPSVNNSFLSPQQMASEYLSRAMKQASVSLALGVFLGAALTTGTAFGLAGAYFVNDRILHKLRSAAVLFVTSARDAALNTREGQALANAVLQHAPASQSSSQSPGTPLAAAEAPQRVKLDNALRKGEVLPDVASPGGHYKAFSVCGSMAYLSGYTSRLADGTPIKGILVSEEVASELSSPRPNGALSQPPTYLVTSEGSEAARTCALGHLAILQYCCGGLDNVRRVHKVVCFVNSVPSSGTTFTDSPKVANGYSDLLNAALGMERGAHSRSAVCVSGLPGGAAVEIEAVVELVDPSKVRGVFCTASQA